jgi:hypothetical protein
MSNPCDVPAPIIANKHLSAPSTFTPENLLREARRQKGLAATPVPDVCVLDPDGDMVRRMRAAGRAHQDAAWACYHTDLYRFTEGGLELGLVGCAVGAPFAVLVAEQLFASGCRLLISITSAGRLAELRPPPYFVLIEEPCGMRAPATITGRQPSSVKPIRGWWRRSPGPWSILASLSSVAPPGPPMRRFARRGRRSMP